MARTVNKTYEHQKAEVERNTGSKVRFSHDLGGKRSIAYVLIGDAVIVALALCSPRDNFCRATGRLVSVGRLYNYLYHAEPTKHVFKFKAKFYRWSDPVDSVYNLWAAVGIYPDVIESGGEVYSVFLPEKWFRTNNTDVDKDTTETSVVPAPTQPEQKFTTVRWPPNIVRQEGSISYDIENLNDQITGLKAENQKLTKEIQRARGDANYWLSEAKKTAENQKLTKELQVARGDKYWLRAYAGACRLQDSFRLVPSEDAPWK